ncbi:DUF6461 domain-containing protein [Actinoplanes sichuanensis]|uniref:DUF6461 domain-containing protein n=1 Tax=Actinoplanes sichuanensis TaxID=512349 RepID=A0ABW4AAN4_9ACTN|nr:DUF6461 domain-containing protein [Actinoplanes sichuanensis]
MADRDPGPWQAAGEVGFTVAFGRGLDPGAMLAAYGADPANARVLTQAQAPPPEWGRPLLRAGVLDNALGAPGPVPPWAFCLERGGTEGARAEVLAALSADGGAALALVAGQGMGSFHDYRDGTRAEMFEPGMSYSPRGERPHRFYERAEAIAQRERLPANRACLLAIEEHIGAVLRADLLSGPLATLVLDSPLPPAPPPARTGRPPGRLIGRLDLPAPRPTPPPES